MKIGCQNSFLCLAALASTTIAAPNQVHAEAESFYSALNTSDVVELAIGAELEFIDVQGKGGLAATSTLLDTDNRSPHFQLDKVDLGATVTANQRLQVFTELQADDSGARVDEFVISLAVPEIFGRIELGLDAPLSKINRMTEVYPLIGNSFWRQEELHLAIKNGVKSEGLFLKSAVSLASQRRLNQQRASEDDSFHLIAHGPAKSFNGQGLTGGGILTSGWTSATANLGAEMSGFGFAGKLADSNDVAFLRALPGYDALDTNVGNRQFYWYGARLRLMAYGVEARSELLRSKEGNLRRLGWYVHGSFERQVLENENLPASTIAAIVRSDALFLLDLPSDPTNPLTWGRRLHVAAVQATVSGPLKLDLEYVWLDEYSTPSPKNNEWIVQLRLDWKFTIQRGARL